MIKSLFKSTVAAGALSLGMIGMAQAEPVKAIFGSIFAPGVPLVGCGAIPFAEDAALKAAGFDISVIHSGQLGSETQLAEQVGSGELEMSTITASILAAWVEDLAVLEAYYLYDSVDDVKKVHAAEATAEMFAELLEVANIRVIGLPWLYGERHVFGKKLAREPADFATMRLRVPQTFVSIEGAKSLGANPTPVAYGELYMALQQGIVDAAEAPLAVIAAESFDEPADYLLKTGHLITSQPFIINEDFWQSLTPEQQTALDAAARAGAERVQECVETTEATTLAAWAANGKLQVIDDLNREAIKAKSQAYFSEGLPLSATYKRLVEELK